MTYQIKIAEPVVKMARAEGITRDEFLDVIAVLEDVAKQQFPRADWRVSPIRCTECEWHRVKQTGETWRAVVVIDDGKQRLTLVMLLRRCQETYQVVKQYWEAA